MEKHRGKELLKEKIPKSNPAANRIFQGVCWNYEVKNGNKIGTTIIKIPLKIVFRFVKNRKDGGKNRKDWQRKYYFGDQTPWKWSEIPKTTLRGD
jgi:hypothetical protein